MRVILDMMDLYKGLTRRYLLLAITLISEELFSTFDGSISEGSALAYGDGYTGIGVVCAVGKASGGT